jgi:hypothetical protein
VPSAPLPGIARKSDTSRRSGAASATARAIGCSESPSTEPASESSSSRETSAHVAVSAIPKRPSVSVPVLSKTTASMSRAFSNAIRLRTSSPLPAASAVDTATTSGIARPSACGQAMTITVTARSIANDSGFPSAIHVPNVSAPPPRATIVSHMAARSARSCVFDLDSCACRTSSTTWARNDSAPVRLTVTTRAPSPLTDPPMTSSPAFLDTGTDSPVSIDSSRDELPSTTAPSAGTFSPGFTTTVSPDWSASSATSSMLPSAVRRWASEGMSLANDSSALDASPTERISIQ